MTYGRILFLTALGLILAPFAGYLGATTMPSLVIIWLWSLAIAIFSNLKAAATLAAMPGLVGTLVAWPLTCIMFPVAGLIFSPARFWAPAAFLVIGCIGGVAAIYASSHFWPVFVYAKNWTDFVLPAAFAGGILGALYGFALWRFDRHLRLRTRDKLPVKFTPPSSPDFRSAA